MITLQDVRKTFDDEAVLDGIDLHVGPAESMIVLGGSGSGKSTLLKLIVGLMRCDSGDIVVSDQHITALKEDDLMAVRQNVGIVFQEGAIFDSLTIRENVAYRLYDEGGWEEDEIEEQVMKLLGFVDLGHTIDMMPSELSGGMRRRVAIARALMGNPRVMLYDEPTAGLDPVTSRTICNLMVKLRDLEGVTSIVVTHDLNAAFFLSNHSARLTDSGETEIVPEGKDFCFVHTRFCVLNSGKIIFEGNKQDLLESGDPYVKEFIT